jgi:maleylacetoacetate isomerase/maleylpyruvate isomerase
MYTLYTYWRSSTAYRARIALNLKRIPYKAEYVSLPKGDHHAAAYLAVNPQGLVPTLMDGSRIIVQSLAIMEYLEEVHPLPSLLPEDSPGRAYVRALAQIVGCEMHPLNNVRVLRYLEARLQVDESGRNAWYAHWIAEGFRAFEAMLRTSGRSGAFCLGDGPTLADVCLVPQVYNARRFNCPLDAYPLLLRIAGHCEASPEFRAARPEVQEDAPTSS